MDNLISFVGWATAWLLIIGSFSFGVMIANHINPQSRALKSIFGGAGLLTFCVIVAKAVPLTAIQNGGDNLYFGRLVIHIVVATSTSVWAWLTYVAAIVGNIDLMKRGYKLVTGKIHGT